VSGNTTKKMKFWCVRIFTTSVYYPRHVCPSFPMYERGSHSTDWHLLLGT